MSDIEYIRLLNGVHFQGETRGTLPVRGHEKKTSITLESGVFSVAHDDERIEIPMHNVVSFKLLVKPAAKK